MKILITCYYDIVDALKGASDSLEKEGCIVDSFPLYKYYQDAYDKTDNYLELLDNAIKDGIDVVLWWFFNIPTLDMEKIVSKNPQAKHIMFNWDEPYNWNSCDIENKAKFFDCVFVTAEERLSDYIKFGCRKAVLLYPGFDRDIHHYLLEENYDDQVKYGCDISICCTNLYDNDSLYPNQYIKRKELVDALYNNQEKYNYKFKIFCPQNIGELYPKSYGGMVKYSDTNKVFNYSKINICTHVQNNSFKYLNERVILVLASGGLLCVDKVNGIETLLSNDECIIMDKVNYIEQIVNVLNNYKKYYQVRHKGNKLAQKYSWDEWAKCIIKNLN